jgi:hypothetical protein
MALALNGGLPPAEEMAITHGENKKQIKEGRI